HFVVARISERTIVRVVERVPGAAAVERFGIVNDAAAFTVNERAIEPLVAVAFAGRPITHVARRHPDTVSRNAARAIVLAEAHEAFARRCVGGEKRNRWRGGHSGGA